MLRSLAASDIDAIVDNLIIEAGSTAVVRFVDALEAGLRHTASARGSGSLKFGYELGIPELRAWRASTLTIGPEPRGESRYCRRSQLGVIAVCVAPQR